MHVHTEHGLLQKEIMLYVSWWERNQTVNEPVMKVSNDNGATFGPTLKLAANGTIGSSGEGGA
jgi:hypothetical protein